MNQEQVNEWLRSLKPGDKVGVYERGGAKFLHERTLVRKTPSGRFVCEPESTFRPDGYNHVAAGSVYADRRIMPPPTDKKA